MSKKVKTTESLDLSPQPLQRPPDLSGGANEELALRGVTGMLNNPAITGAGLPAKEQAQMRTVLEGIASALPEGCAPPPPPPKHSPVAKPRPASPPAENPAIVVPAANRIFFTGRLGVGKDYVASAAGFPIIGFADPIYTLATHFFGVPVNAMEGKDLPGMRVFLQAIGQWGRGEVNDQYPYSPTRAMFITMVRSLADAKVLPDGIAWSQFGKTQDFWIDALLERAKDSQRIAITNCRFNNEFERLKLGGWQHYHVLCSPTTWEKRLATKKLTSASPAVKDFSERLAQQLDTSLVQIISKQKLGPKLRVIWNDPGVPSPSQRLLTLDEFLSSAKEDETTDVSSLIV